MPAQNFSLEYLLPLLSKSFPERLIQVEISSLNKVISDILFEIDQRKRLESRLMGDLESRITHLHIQIMKTDNLYAIGPTQPAIELEHDLTRIEDKKIHTREQTMKDLLELKKLLWHYWLLLQKKQAQLSILR